MKKNIGSYNYGFYGRLTANFPSQLLVDATEICNLACAHCPHQEFKKSEHYAGRRLDKYLNEKLVEEVRDYGQNSTQYIRYASNGEPLTHPEIYSMLEYAKRRSGVMVTLTTNGTLMTEDAIEKLLGALVDVVDVSIDAFSPETYSNIRIKGNLLITRSNVLKLIQKSKHFGSKTKVVVSYVEQPQNQHETSEFEKFWSDNGADFVIIRRMHSCSGAKKDLAETRRENNMKKMRRPCLYPWERIVLNARGDMAFCPSDWVHGSYINDYRKTTIHEAWQSNFYQSLRQAHLTNIFLKHHFCAQCPDWESTRWPQEGKSYANMMEEFRTLK